MTSYRVIYSKQAEKFIKKNKKIGSMFMTAFSSIAYNIENTKYYNIKIYHSSRYNDVYRLRIGDYRAVFRIIGGKLVVYIFDIGSRGDIYKRVSI